MFRKKGFYDMSEKQVDLLCRDVDNKIVSCEIANSPNHEVDNALFCLACDEVRKHVVICTSKKTLDAVKRQFKEVVGLAGNERVEIVTLAQVLNDDDWMP